METIGYNGFLFPHLYSIMWKKNAPRPSPEYKCGKRNPLYPIRVASFVLIEHYLMLVVNPNTVLNLLNHMINMWLN